MTSHERYGISNRWRLDCLFIAYTGQHLRKIALCGGNLPATDRFPSQRAANVEKVSMSWHSHDRLTDERMIMALATYTPFRMKRGEGEIDNFSQQLNGFTKPHTRKTYQFHCQFLGCYSILPTSNRYPNSQKKILKPKHSFQSVNFVPRYGEFFIKFALVCGSYTQPMMYVNQTKIWKFVTNITTFQCP